MSDLQNIINAAAVVVGPRENLPADGPSWEDRIIEAAEDLQILGGEKSPVTRRLAKLESCKVMTGAIGGAHLHKRSGRVIVGFASAINDKNESGTETARTEIITNNATNKALANRLRALTGHKVLVWIDMQEAGAGSGRKMRVIAKVQDLGLADDFFLSKTGGLEAASNDAAAVANG